MSAFASPFDTLVPGQCFATKYGVIEVINDNRAIAHSRACGRFRFKDHYYCSDHKRDLQIKKVFLTTRARARCCDNCTKRLI